MIQNAYSFYDSKSGLFSSPFYFPADGAAIRAAVEIGLDRQTSISRHPADYTLMQIGKWDDQTGQFTQEMHVSLGVVATLLQQLGPKQPGFFEGGNE